MQVSTGRLSTAACVAAFVWTTLACHAEGGVPTKGEDTKSLIDEVTWSYDTSPFGPSEVVTAVPKNASVENPMPVLIALHGQGESRKRPSLGARGWLDDYKMVRAISRLSSPPLTSADFGGMVDDTRLRFLNDALKRKPYRGLIVVCPYLPDRFGPKHLYEDAGKYGDFLLSKIVPRVYRETPSVQRTESTGIDGVSLGGRVAVVVGLTHAARFGAVGGTQAAFRTEQADEIADLVGKAREQNPGLRFRVLSSAEDRFAPVTRLISAALERRKLGHQMEIVQGNHSYEFNRGPGVYEMLLYYDRILRGESF